MPRFFLQSLMLSITLAGAQLNAQGVNMSDSDYLQQRAANLNGRIDKAVRRHRLSAKKADKLRVAVGKVQSSAGNLQARNGTIAREDADRLNQDLTNVERTLNGEPN